MNLVTDNDVMQDYISKSINAASVVEWQLGPLINIIVTQLFSSQLILKLFIVVSFFICALWYILHHIYPSKIFMRVRLHLGRPPPPLSVRIQDAITAIRPSIFSAIHIALVWCPSSIHHLRKSIKFTTLNQRPIKSHERRRYKGYLFLL